MNFDFSDEQNMLRDQARRFLSEASSREQVRTWLNTPEEATKVLWPQLAEMGWLGAAIDEAHGGLGLGALELCILNEELGRALAPTPFFATVCVSAEALSRCAASDLRNDLLTRIATGKAIVSPAWATDADDWLHSAHLPVWSGDMLQGKVKTVSNLAEATDLLVLARTESNEVVLLHVNASSSGIARQALAGFDLLRPHGALSLSDVPATVLAQGAALRDLLEDVRNRCAVYAAFEQIGSADSAMSLARDYTLQRYAFGRPLAGNQAVKHRLADMMVKIELARSNAYFGAWAASVNDAELARSAGAARLAATEALTFAAEETLHLHGGIGYTWEADCHLFYRRSRLLAVNLGNTAAWSRRLVQNSKAAAA